MGVRYVLNNFKICSFRVFPRPFGPETVAEAIVILQQGILADGAQPVGNDEVADHIQVPALTAKLLVFHEHAMQFEIEHAANASCYLTSSARGEEIVIGGILPCLAFGAVPTAWQGDQEVAVEWLFLSAPLM